MGNCCSAPTAVNEDYADFVVEDPKKSKKSAKEDPSKLGGLSEEFEIQKLLGEGATGKAFLCKDRQTGEIVAIKAMLRPIQKALATCFVRELQVQAQLGEGHVNIVKPQDVLLTRTHLCIVMEYVDGGNLAEAVVKKAKDKYGSLSKCTGLVFEEDEARYFFHQIMDAIDFCHRHNIAHRDLKLDNVMLDSSEPPRVKVIDFGFANKWTDNSGTMMKSFIGTMDYMSPQLVHIKENNFNRADSYDAVKADIWAAGVLLVVMLVGRFPFDTMELSMFASTIDEMKAPKKAPDTDRRRDLAQRRYSLLTVTSKMMDWLDMPQLQPVLGYMSADVKDMLSSIFMLDETKRATVADIKAHKWYNEPTTPKLAAALEEMAKEQSAANTKLASGAFQNRMRDAALEKVVKQAAHTYDPSEQPQSVTRLSDSGQRMEQAAAGVRIGRRISLVRVETEYQQNLDAIREDANAHDDQDERPTANGKALAAH